MEYLFAIDIFQQGIFQNFFASFNKMSVSLCHKNPPFICFYSLVTFELYHTLLHFSTFLTFILLLFFIKIISNKKGGLFLKNFKLKLSDSEGNFCYYEVIASSRESALNFSQKNFSRKFGHEAQIIEESQSSGFPIIKKLL